MTLRGVGVDSGLRRVCVFNFRVGFLVGFWWFGGLVFVLGWRLGGWGLWVVAVRCFSWVWIVMSFDWFGWLDLILFSLGVCCFCALIV